MPDVQDLSHPGTALEASRDPASLLKGLGPRGC